MLMARSPIRSRSLLTFMTQHKTKIRGHGLVQGENLQALFFDLHFLLINGEVQFMDTGRKFCILS